MRVYAMALLFICSACESKPTKAQTAPAPATPAAEAPAGKVTRAGGGSMTAVELQAELEDGPEGADTVILTDETVLECLRRFIDPKDIGFSMHLTGKLNGTGKLASASVHARGKSYAKGLPACLMPPVKKLKFDPAARGELKMHISRGATGGKKMKSFILELKGPKKFE